MSFTIICLHTFSGINDLTEVAIYLNGELLDEDTEYDVTVGDNFMCQPTDNTALVTTYVWVKSTAYNAVGPNIIQTANNEDGSNRYHNRGAKQGGLGG